MTFSLINFTNLSGDTIITFLSNNSLHNKILSTELDQLCTGIKLYPSWIYGIFGRLLILSAKLRVFSKPPHRLYLADIIGFLFKNLIISITSSANSGVLSCLISNQLGAPFIILEHKTHYQRNLIRFSHKRLH